MRIGLIIRIETEGGFGIIKDENDQEISFHLADLATEVSPGDGVWFEIILTQAGLKAMIIQNGETSKHERA